MKLGYLPGNILINMFYFLFYSYLIYYIEAMGFVRISALDPFFILHKKQLN